MENNQLLLFVKNTELGKVKTRLAKTIGDEKALFIYKALLQHTYTITNKVNAFKKVYYSTFVDSNDEFENDAFEKRVQVQDPNLGVRMYNAFKDCFKEQAEKVVLIGSDCYELDEKILAEAFAILAEKDFVIGPAKDGGYYLIGMKKLNRSIFEGIEWSTENVFLDTILAIKNESGSYGVLPTLSDVDEEKDLGSLRNFI